MKRITYLRRIIQLLPPEHSLVPSLEHALEVLKSELQLEVEQRRAALKTQSPLPESGCGPRVLVFSNVQYPEGRKLTTLPGDILVFLNKAATAHYYKNTEAQKKICYRRSKDESYGKDLDFCENRFVFGDGGIPKEFLAALKKSYNWDYYIEPGKTRCATTGYMVVKYLEHLYPDREIVLVNFGYDVKHSTYRCPWHSGSCPLCHDRLYGGQVP